MHTIIEVFLLFVVPVLATKWYRESWKYWDIVVFSGVVLAVAIDAFINHMTLYQMGVRTDNLLQALEIYIPAVIVAIIVLWLCSRLLHTKHITPWKKYPMFIPVAIFLSICQQFIYQGFLLQLLSSQYAVPTAIIITALLYAFLHILFPRPWFSFFLTFAGGIMFATLFTLEPNLFVASVAHTILNIAAIQFSFVAFVDQDGLLQHMI